MVDEAHQTEKTQDDVAEGLEELLEEDAAIEIDFDQDFEAAVESVGTEGDSPMGESTTAVDDAKGPDAIVSSELVADLERQIAGLKAQLEDRTNQYMRIVADFENFRRRTSKEKDDLEVQIKCSAISELLPVVDNFERARSQIKPQSEAEMTIHKSYQSVYKQLVDCLKRVGVSAMRAEGQPFDPNLHEAVMRETTDQYPEGTVMDELVRGYLLGERVLRHAMVKVSAMPDPSELSDETPPESEVG